MAEKAARYKRAKRAAAGEPKGSERIIEYQCRRDPKVVVKLTCGEKGTLFFASEAKSGQVREKSNYNRNRLVGGRERERERERGIRVNVKAGFEEGGRG